MLPGCVQRNRHTGGVVGIARVEDKKLSTAILEDRIQHIESVGESVLLVVIYIYSLKHSGNICGTA